MDMPKDIKNSIFFFAIVCVVILWQMLLPGYILTLDMVFAPHFNFWLSNNNFLTSLPFVYFLQFLNLFFTGWIVQKILIIGLFFLIGYLAYLSLPVPDKYYARYFAALFYLINPFVYERFLAGQITVLFAYAFFPPFLAALIKFHREPIWKNSFKLFGWLILINIFSLHLFVMSALVLAGYFLVNLFLTISSHHPQTSPPAGGESLKRRGNWIIKFLIGGLLFLLMSSYWLVPYFFHQNYSVINNFDQSNWEAFKTAGDKHLGTAFNVLVLYGFWEEHEPWAGYFISPKDNFVFWLITVLALFTLIIFGLIRGWKKQKKLAAALLFIGIGAFIFSCGIGDTVFKNFNFWLFEHFSFWRGFRDSEKWTSHLVLVYAIFSGWGIVYLSEFLEKKKIGRYFVWLLMTLAILGTYAELGGFARQLQPVWYPQSWYEVKKILDNDKSDYKVLFLPWHMYLSLNFNHKLITANPAGQFFGPKIIQSNDMEMPGVTVINDYFDLKSMPVDEVATNNNLTPEIVADILQRNKVKYIIYVSDLVGVDKYRYDFLNQGSFHLMSEGKDLKLFTFVEK
jgi:hypothetical protein